MFESHDIDRLINEYSCDTSSQSSSQSFMQNTSYQQENEKLKLENDKLTLENDKMRKHTCELMQVANGVLKDSKNYTSKISKLERELLEEQHEIERLKLSNQELLTRYTDESHASVNRIFHLEQTMNQMEEIHKIETDDYVSLCEEYMSLMSDVTCFYNYEFKKHQNKFISKIEKVLYQRYKGEYEKPKIVRKRAVKDVDDDTSSICSSLSKSSKRSKNSRTVSSKKLKTEIHEFQSISQVASPASTMSFDEDSSGFVSTYTGLSPPVTKPPAAVQCRCQEDLPLLVSVGTNTDVYEELPSLPCLSDSEDSTLNSMSDQIESSLDCELPESEMEVQTAAVEGKNISINNMFHNYTKIKAYSHSSDITLTQESSQNTSIQDIPIIVMVDSSTSTDQLPTETTTKPSMVSSSTATDAPTTSDKSVNTCKSTTTRGTATTKVVTKAFGMQFPDLTMNNIFDEFTFEMPEMLNPIDDLDAPNTKDAGTVTELRNVNREIDYLCNQPLKIKIEKSSFDNGIDDMNGEQFHQLGKAVFEILLQRSRQKHGSSEDSMLRDEVWNMINSRLIEKESAIDISFTDTEKSSSNDWQRVQVPTKAGYEHSIAIACDNENHIERISLDVETCPDIPETINELVESEPDSEMTNNKEVHLPTSEHADAADDVEPQQQENLASTNLDLATSVEPEFDVIMRDMKSVLFAPLPDLLGEIDDLSDTIWNELFPKIIPTEEASDDADGDYESPASPENILAEYDFDNDILEIPMEAEVHFTENDTPKSPEPFVNQQCCEQDPTEIPFDTQIPPAASSVSECFMKYDDEKRMRLLTWQIKHTQLSKTSKQLVGELEGAIETYLEAEWTSESTEACVRVLLAAQPQALISKTIFNIVKKFKHDREICMEYTPPAPPLPRYLQKLILLVEKLSKSLRTLPKRLVEELEENIFLCQKASVSKLECDDMRNFAYYYSSLVDLFYEGDTSMVFYFIVKSIYFFGQRALPMIFVLIKSFPHCLVKKSLLLRKTCPQIDWDNMSGIEVSRVQLNNDDVDSLDLTVMFILTFPPLYARFGEYGKHELFNYLPKFYGFYLGQMGPAKLLSTLLARLEMGRLENLSLSLILFGRIMEPVYTIENLVKSNLYPLLSKLSQLDRLEVGQIGQICVLIEVITAILKCFTAEKERSIKVIVPKIIEIYQRFRQHRRIREGCIKSLLRLQRMCGAHHKDIMAMLKTHVENDKSCISEDLYATIETFIYRKKKCDFHNEFNPT